jgi:hypothetical protein
MVVSDANAAAEFPAFLYIYVGNVFQVAHRVMK